MKIQFEKNEQANGKTHYTYTLGVVYDNDGYRVTHHPFDSNTLNGLACLTGNTVLDYYEDDSNKITKQTVTLSAKQVRGLAYLGLNPYYVKDSGKVDAEICYIQ